MFMTARELHDDIAHGDASAYEGSVPGMDRTTAMWEDKNNTSTRNGLKKDIVERGVVEPVELGPSSLWSGTPDKEVHGTMLINGHHRVASEFANNPDRYIPVVHHDSFDASMAYDSQRRKDLRYQDTWEES